MKNEIGKITTQEQANKRRKVRAAILAGKLVEIKVVDNGYEATVQNETLRWGKASFGQTPKEVEEALWRLFGEKRYYEEALIANGAYIKA